MGLSIYYRNYNWKAKENGVLLREQEKKHLRDDYKRKQNYCDSDDLELRRNLSICLDCD